MIGALEQMMLEQAVADIRRAIVELSKKKSLNASCSLQDADVALQAVRDELRAQRGVKQDPRTPREVYPPLKLIRGGKR